MPTSRSDPWFEPTGMEAWTRGMADALGRRVRIVCRDGRELAAAGEGSGDASSWPLVVNGHEVGAIEIIPAELDTVARTRVVFAVDTFKSLAEARHTVTDLAQTTARQWRELSLLYRTSELLRSDLETSDIAASLLEQSVRALRPAAACVRSHTPSGEIDHSRHGDARTLDAVAAWGESLAEGVVADGREELKQLGGPDTVPDRPLLVVPIRSGDEGFGALALIAAADRRLGSEELKLAGLLADQAGLAFANRSLLERERDAEALRREMEVATAIQASILPPRHQSWTWLEAAAVCRPAAWVGGDAYIARRLDDGSVVVGVTDVSGHGVSSALLTNALISQLRALATTSPDPVDLLTIANQLVAERVGTMGLFVTATLMRIRPDGSARAVSAGHPPPVIVSPDGRTELVHGDGLPLGVMADEHYPAVDLELPPGALVVLYSDGLTEASDPTGTMFGIGRVEATASRLSTASASAAAALDQLLDELAAFTGGTPLADDLTALCVRRS